MRVSSEASHLGKIVGGVDFGVRPQRGGNDVGRVGSMVVMRDNVRW